MKISYNWLRTLINTDLSARELAEKLTQCGLEVESVTPYQNIKGGLEGIRIGKVVSCTEHPNADRLKLTKVDLGKAELLTIVCGAANVAEGQHVLVAPIGSTVHPTHGDPFEIKRTKIRGEWSEGMICAEDEVGLGSSHEGILVLPDNAKPGELATTLFPVYTDFTIEIGLTANRGDAASHLGVARDLCAMLGCTIHRHESVFVIPKPVSDTSIQVKIDDTDTCLRYTGISIRNIRVKPSPEWMQQRLRAIGIQPINNIVDCTNYVMHELGQPMHAFDADKISGKTIVVKRATPHTKFTTLDGTERTLTGSECIICDAEKPLAIAGVYGGLESGITANTTHIFLESAYFHPASVRKTARLHGLNTDSSFRYERGTDPQITDDALKRCVQLILECTSGDVASPLINHYPTPVVPVQIDFRIERFYKLIGQEIPLADIVAILTGLGISVRTVSEHLLQLIVPPYKSDVTREADIAEEILRIYGLDRIEIPNQIKSALSKSESETNWNLKHKIAHFLTACGFIEMLSNSLTKKEYYSEDELQQAVNLLNPLSSDLSILRMTLLFDGLEMIQYNRNRKIGDIQGFEFGLQYTQDNTGIHEKPILALFMSGNKEPENWQHASAETTLYRIKSIAERVLIQAGILSYEWHAIASHSKFNYAMQVVSNQTPLAEVGLVKTTHTRHFDIDTAVYAAFFDWDAVLSVRNHHSFIYKEVSPFPIVRRDLALLLDKHVSYAEIERHIHALSNPLLNEIGIFDVYEGDRLPEGKKSYAISLWLQPSDKTLTDEETEQIVKQVIQTLEKNTGATLRS